MEKNSRNSYYILILLIVVQVSLAIFWGSRKENYYWDEYYSMMRTHCISDSTSYDHNITGDLEYEENKWIPVSIVNKLLTVDKSETVLNDSVFHTLIKLVKYNNYFVLLNVVQGLFFPNVKTAWAAIILNCIILIIHQVLLYKLSQKLTKNPNLPLFVTAFYGFSSICLSMTVFIRFYLYATLMNTIFVFVHFFYWNSEEKAHFKRILYLGTIVLSVLIGFNNAQFMIFFVLFFMIFFAIGLLVKKGLKSFMFYAVPVFGGGFLYAATQTFYLQAFYDFENFFEKSDGAIRWLLEQMTMTEISMIPGRFSDMAYLIGKYMFGSFFVMIFLVAILVAGFVIKLFKNSNDVETKIIDPFIIIILVSTVVYFVFFTVFGLFDQIRYVSYVFPELAMLIVFAIYYVYKNKKYYVFLLVALVFLQVASVNLKGKVDMLYTSDGDDIKNILSENADSIFLYGGAGNDFMIYQASVFVGGEAELYAYNKDGNIKLVENDLKNDMLLMVVNGTDFSDLQELLEYKGYTTDFVGVTYAFTVYRTKVE